MGKAKCLLFLFFLIEVSGCSSASKKEIRSRADLIAYLNDPEKGLQKKDSIGKIEVALTYRPWQMEIFKQPSFSSKNKVPSTFVKDRLTFVLSLSANHKELLKQLDFGKYSEMVQVFAFRMREFVKAIPDDKEAVDALDCLYQQTYGMGTANNLLIVFDKKKLVNANILAIQVKEFGLGTGNLIFKIKLNDIKNIPFAELN